MGNRYESDQWVHFLCDPHDPTPSMLGHQRRVTDLTLSCLRLWAERCDLTLDEPSGEDAHRIAWRTFASVVGHGVGLWDGELEGLFGGLLNIEASQAAEALNAFDTFVREDDAATRLRFRCERLDEEVSLINEGGEE